MSTIKVIEINTNDTIFECDVADSEKAYEYAAEMEKLGLEVRVDNPSITKTLSDSLGVSEEDWKKVEKELEDEIEGHNESDSCCRTTTDSSDTHH